MYVFKPVARKDKATVIETVMLVMNNAINSTKFVEFNHFK